MPSLNSLLVLALALGSLAGAPRTADANHAEPARSCSDLDARTVLANLTPSIVHSLRTPPREWRADLDGDGADERIVVARTRGAPFGDHPGLPANVQASDHVVVLRCDGAWQEAGREVFDATFDENVDVDGEFKPGVLTVDARSYRLPNGARVLAVIDEYGRAGWDPRHWGRAMHWFVLGPGALERVFDAPLVSMVVRGPERRGGISSYRIAAGPRRFRIRVRWRSTPLGLNDAPCRGRGAYAWDGERFAPLPSLRRAEGRCPRF